MPTNGGAVIKYLKLEQRSGVARFCLAHPARRCASSAFRLRVPAQYSGLKILCPTLHREVNRHTESVWGCPHPRSLQAVPSLPFRDDLVFTCARLLADPNVSSLAKILIALIEDWTTVQSKQFDLWDAITKADALVAAADDNLDDFTAR